MGTAGEAQDEERTAAWAACFLVVDVARHGTGTVLGKVGNCRSAQIILDATVSDVSYTNPTHTDIRVQYNYVRTPTSCFSR